MRKTVWVLSALLIAAPVFAQPQSDLTPQQRYNFWTRCAAMFDIVGKGKRENANLPDAEKYEGAAKQARDNSLKEAGGLKVGRDDVEKGIREMTDQFNRTLATGDKSTEAAFGTAIEVCASSLMP